MAALTTIKHYQFGHRCPAVISDIKDDGSQAGVGEPRDNVNLGASTEFCWKDNGEESEGSKKKWRPGGQALPPEQQR